MCEEVFCGGRANDSSEDKRPSSVPIHASICERAQNVDVDLVLSEDEGSSQNESYEIKGDAKESANSSELYRTLQARTNNEFDSYADWLYSQLKGTLAEKAKQLEELLATKRPVWQDRMPSVWKKKVTSVIEKLKGKRLTSHREFAASINHDLSNQGSTLRVDATFNYEIRVNDNRVAAVPKVGVL